MMAARTRSRASRTALSARPTTAKAGSPRRMSASTHTRRAAIPSRQNVLTRARLMTGGGPSERGLQVVEADEPVALVDDDPDRVAADAGEMRPLAVLGEPGA